MRFGRGYRSDDVIDRRGQRSVGRGGRGGLGLGLLGMLLRSRFGWFGVLLSIALYVLVGQCEQRQQLAEHHDAPVSQAATDDLTSFVSTVLDDAQTSWQARAPIEVPGAAAAPYRKAKLVLFTDATSTACGFGEAASGPFYCPADERVYIDLGFYQELRDRLGAPGDFAQAYVIAHEIGHHVQHLLGLSGQVHRAPQAAQGGQTGLSVRLELQADCFAGVWAHDAARRGLLEPGDIEEAIHAAGAIGDDRLQKLARGTVRPESFRHGSSEQRARWFRRGHEAGDPRACDTFGASQL